MLKSKDKNLKVLECKDKKLKILECKNKELKVQEKVKCQINSKQNKLKNLSSDNHMMWVYFEMFSFIVTLLLKVGILSIYGEDLRKIPTENELNQVVK